MDGQSRAEEKKVLFWAVNKRGPEKHTFVNKSQGVQALES